MAPGADLTAHPPARIPKLKYRNPLPVDDNPSLQDIPGRIDSHSPDAQEPPTPSIKSPSTAYRPSFESGRLTSPSLASVPSSAASSDDSKSSKKKKKTGSVFGFLSLKEPSQVALEQFAEAQRKQATDKGPASPNSPRSSHSGVAQKLPPTVPKVNSKWDGVPESVKKRQSQAIAPSKDRTTSSKRDSSGSAFTTSSKYTTFLSSLKDGAREPPSPTAPSVKNTNLPIRQNSTSKSTRKSTSSTPDTPDDLEHSMTGALPDTHRHSRHQAIVVDVPHSPTYDLATSQSADLRPDSPASDADSVDTVVKDTADVLYKKLNDRPHKSFWEDAPAVQPLQDNDIPESHDFLFEAPTSPVAESPVLHDSPPRPVLNFSRPTSSQNYARSADGSFYKTSPRTSALPTLYETSLASVESFGMVHNDDDAYSLAPSTVAPTVLSEQWHDSPRERLGLGGHLRMHDVLPWEGQQESGKPKKNRLSIFGKATART